MAFPSSKFKTVYDICFVLKLFKSFTPQTILLLLLFATVIKFGFLIDPPVIYVHKDEWGFQWLIQNLLRAMGNESVTLTLISLINLVLQALLVNRLATEYKLFQSESFVPAAVFILVSSFIPDWNTLSAPMIASWPILITINNLMRLSTTQSPRKLLFNSGMFVALASIIYYPACLFLLFIIWSRIILKPVTFKEVIILILGFLTPLYFLGIILFLMDYPIQEKKFSYLNIIQIKEDLRNYKLFVTIGLMGILLTIGTYCVNHIMDKLIEAIKKSWWMVIITLITSCIIAIFPVGKENASWYFCLVPASLIISAIWMSSTNKWLKIILFWLILGGIVYIQYF